MPSRAITGVLGAVAAVMGVLTALQALQEPLGSNPAPTWFYAAMFGLFAVFTAWFRRLVVRIDGDGVMAAYGPLRRRVPWRDVERLEEDAPGAFYGGWGVRLGYRHGRFVWVFNVIGGRHLAVVPRDGAGAGLVFAVRRPDEALRTAAAYLAATPSR